MKFEKKTVIINGRKTFYWQKGYNQKEVIVFLHGLSGNHKGLIDLANGFNKDYRIIIPDLPACGLSEELREQHTLENYVKWLDDFLEILSIHKVIIVGHSFGARIALVFSVSHPKKIKFLILITPIIKVDGFIARIVFIEYKIIKILPDPLKRILLQLSSNLHRKVCNIIIFKSVSAKRRKQIMSWGAKDPKSLNPEINIELFDEVYKLNLMSLAKKNKTKSLIIASDSDRIVRLDYIKEFVSLLNNTKFKIVKKSGHVVPMEKPITMSKIIQTWLDVNIS